MSAPRITKISQSKLRESAYTMLRDAFNRGEFAPGETVTMRGLAEQLGISMTTVREAVRRLVAEGCLIDTPSRKLEVPSFDTRRVQDLRDARLALELLVLKESVARIDTAAIDALEEIVNRPRPPGLTGPDLEANYDFHFSLYRHAGSEVLLPIINALWLQYGSHLNRIINHADASKIDEHVHHVEIIAALRNADGAAAEAALRKDIERSFRILLSPGNAVKA